MAHSYRGPGRRPGVGQRGGRVARRALHDLSNQIHALAVTAQLALDTAAGPPERHRRYLHEIEGTCRELGRLARRLHELDLAPEGDAYAVVCTHCSRAILTVAQIGEPEARQMADHLRTLHPELL